MNNKHDIIDIKDSSTDARFIVDSRYFPFFIAHWFGVPTNELVDQFIQVRRPLFERAVAERIKTVQITDLTQFERPPAIVRKYIAESGMHQDKEFDEVFAGYVMVVPNALIRGVVTAVIWLTGGVKPTVLAPSIDDAFTKDFSQDLGVDLRGVNCVGYNLT